MRCLHWTRWPPRSFPFCKSSPVLNHLLRMQSYTIYLEVRPTETQLLLSRHVWDYQPTLTIPLCWCNGARMVYAASHREITAAGVREYLSPYQVPLATMGQLQLAPAIPLGQVQVDPAQQIRPRRRDRMQPVLVLPLLGPIRLPLPHPCSDRCQRPLAPPGRFQPSYQHTLHAVAKPFAALLACQQNTP